MTISDILTIAEGEEKHTFSHQMTIRNEATIKNGSLKIDQTGYQLAKYTN